MGRIAELKRKQINERFQDLQKRLDKEAKIISRLEIRAAAGEFSDFLKERNICFYEDLHRINGANFSMKKDSRNSIEVSLETSRKDDSNSVLCVADYKKDNGMILIRLMINNRRDYAGVVIKADSDLKGYSFFERDEAGNIVQYKGFDPKKIKDKSTNPEEFKDKSSDYTLIEGMKRELAGLANIK